MYQYRARRKYVSVTNKQNFWQPGGDGSSIVQFAFSALIKNELCLSSSS
jgi:hypothetical protein